MINTREELIIALNEAAEIEHSLLIQYLFAAFSLKQSVKEGVTELQLEEINEWKRTILQIAREEMVHFGSVCNLLSAVGAGPRILRSNFPKQTDYFYQLDAPFILSKFDKTTVSRFTIFELPQEMPDIKRSYFMADFAPDPITYNKVGELYSSILDAFHRNPDFLIGDVKNQDVNGWSLERRKPIEEKILFPINNIKDVERAIDNIIEEGEGTTIKPGDIEKSHYGKFIKILNRLDEVEYEPARNVIENPATRINRDSDPSIKVNLIKLENSLKPCELFNSIYNSMLISIMQYYSHFGESQDEKEFLKNVSWQCMSGIIRPLGEIITTLPFTKSDDGFTCGPSFEIYGDYTIAPTKENRYTILLERWKDHYESAKEIEHLSKTHPRFKSIIQKTNWVYKNVESFINSRK
jgi:hypothetical protein